MKALLPLSGRAADAAIAAMLAAARGRKSAAERRQRVAQALEPFLREVAILGLDQAILAADAIKREVRGHD